MSAKKNPLYVVTDNGNTVEQANGMVDAMIKKLGLESMINLMNSILSLMTDQVGNYGFFLYLQEIVDQFAVFIESIIEKVSLFIPSNS